MRYVLTGASGHIGNNLVRLINREEPNAEVIALVRRKVTRELTNAVCKQVLGDLASERFLEENIREGDVVVHLAGLIDLSEKRYEECRRVNVELTKKILSVSMKKGVKKFIYTGSVDGIYKAETKGEIAEPKAYFPEKMQGSYPKTKAEAMAFLQALMEENPTANVAMVLPSAVVGVNDYKPSEAGKIILKTAQGGAQFCVKGGYNFVDVEDVCKGIFALAKNERRGTYILSGYDVSVRELYGHINRVKGWKKKPVCVPTWLAKGATVFMKNMTAAMIRTLNEPHSYSCQKAERELGYVRTPTAKTFEKAVRWLEENAEKGAEKNAD